MGRLPAAGATRNGRQQGMPWTILPLHHDVPAPPLPSWREWNPATVSWWKDLWTRPQAACWDPTGFTLDVLAMLHDDVFSGRVEMKRVSAEIRQWGDLHGLTPKAMVGLRWRLASETDSAVEAPSTPEEGSSTARRRRLMVVQNDGAA